MLRSSALLLLILSGCMANDGLGSLATSETNIYKMSYLSLGMKQWEVLQLMRQPYSYETFEIDDSVYDVWFYVTKPTVLGQSRMVPQNLTPLTFKNGELIGWGFAYYHYLVKKEEAIDAQKTDSAEKKLEDEDLEKALQTPPSSKTTPQKPVKPIPAPPAEPVEKKKPPQNTPTQKPTPKKTETIKVTPLKVEPMDKLQPNAPQKQKVEPLKPPPTSKPGSQQPPSKTGNLSMSSSPKKPPATPTQPEKKPPIDEEDSDMIDEASDQNFNQT